jgi:uncharacterized metal-binding protein
MSCGCSPDRKCLIYSCSGSANTGYLADQVARRLSLQGQGKMTCLAGVGAELDGFLGGAAKAGLNLVLDGCPTACGHRTFERLGLAHASVILTDLGIEKGKTLIDENLIEQTAGHIACTWVQPAAPDQA